MGTRPGRAFRGYDTGMSDVDPGGADSLDVARVARTAGPSFGRRVVELAHGAELAFDPAIWRTPLVAFCWRGGGAVRGGGASHRFGPGDIVCFTRLPVRTLRNCGPVPVRLLAIWRHAAQR